MKEKKRKYIKQQNRQSKASVLQQLMIRELLVICLLCLIFAQETHIESLNKRIKVGLVKVELNEDDQGTISLTYKTPMPDPTYRTLATPAYILNFSPAHGLQVLTDCSGPQNQTQLYCLVIANSTSANSLLYMTYVVSDEQDFIVEFQMKSTDLVSRIQHKVDISSSSLFRKAQGEIDFLPFLSGVSSIDEDFGLQISLTQSFDLLTSTLSIEVLISEMDEKNLTITFGFILFLPKVYVINNFPDYRLEPNNYNSNKQVLFYIEQINPITQSRLLQAVPLNKTSVKAPQDPTNQVSAVESQIQQQKIFENIILDGNFSLKDFQTKTTKPTLASRSIRRSEMLSSPSTIDSSSSSRSSSSTEEEEFQRIFSTNGLTIVLESSFSDPIIYLELNSPVDFQPQRYVAPTGSATFIRPFAYPHSFTLNITINTKLPVAPDCSNGFLVFKMTKIDQIQYTFKYICIRCSWGQYFDWSAKTCILFPLFPYINVVDPA